MATPPRMALRVRLSSFSRSSMEFLPLRQTSPLNQVSTANDFNDVTELDITFTAGPNTTQVFFNTVFASAEYPCCVGSFIDGFGLFLNGANIAFAGGNPVNIDNPDMVNTAFDGWRKRRIVVPDDGLGRRVGRKRECCDYLRRQCNPRQHQYAAVHRCGRQRRRIGHGGVHPGPGQRPPPIGTPEPSTWVMLGLGFAGMGWMGWRRQTRQQQRTA
jgi:hypothetical protein